MNTQLSQSEGMPIKPTLIEQLVLLRHRKGWTQVQCAKRLEITTRTLASWEARQRQPTRLTQKAIRSFIERELEKMQTSAPAER